MFCIYALAERLGKTVGEIRQMPESEFKGWLAYFAAKDKKHGSR